MHFAEVRFNMKGQLSCFAPHSNLIAFHQNKRLRSAKNLRRPQIKCVANSIQKAVSRVYVKDFGRIIELDRNGYFPLENDLQLSSVLQRRLQPAVDIIIKHASDFGIVGIFLRGSVATGNFFAKFKSDLDLIIVLKKTIPSAHKAEVKEKVSNFARSTLNLYGADIRVTKESELEIENHDLSNTCILLRNYSVLLFGDKSFMERIRFKQKPSYSISLNIRKDQRSFLRLLRVGQAKADEELQLSAIQWLCKKCLRAVGDLSSRFTGRHSRDLLPCYQLGSEAFPDYAHIFLLGLQIACCNSDTPFLLKGTNQTKLDFTNFAIGVICDLVEIVEDLTLRQLFHETHNLIPQQVSVNNATLRRPATSALNIQEISKEISLFFRNIFPGHSRTGRSRFKRYQFPKLAIKASEKAHEKSIRVSSKTSSSGLEDILAEVQLPTLHKSVHLASKVGVVSNTCDVLDEIIRMNSLVDCRVSTSNTFIFCRREHVWIKSGVFEPPSVLIALRPQDAISRLRGDSSYPPLFFHGQSEEIYVQTCAKRQQRLFKQENEIKFEIMQDERVWISAHGTVSALHYDASYSVLVQRVGLKRMVFFPDTCLKHMGIYPIGHPLHRRARVDLTRTNSVLFREFWEHCADKAVEVWLRPGDAVVFPPFWAHYTESYSEDPQELSVSHTLRYV